MLRRDFLTLGGSAALLAACGSEPKPSFKAVDITGADYARDFRMTDTEGKVRSVEEFRGKAVIVFFGYTQCPDACPTTLAEIAAARRLLGEDGAKVQPVLVSLDPERDAPEVLQSYVRAFGPDFIALRGTPEQTAALAKDFKVFFRKAPGTSPGSYTIDHTAASYVYDPKGRLRLYVRYNGGPQALADDLKLILQG